MKKFKILEELPKCDTEIQSEQKMLEKMVLMDLLNAKLLPTFHLLKKKKKKQYLGSAIKQSTIKQGMPVVNTDRKYKEKYKHIIKENHQTIKPSKKKTREERHKEQKTWEKKLVKWQ